MRIPLRLDRPLPARIRSFGIQALCGTFACTFDVKAPDVLLLTPEKALWAFREFSAACMEEALASPSYAAERRAALERQARDLGAKVRSVLRPRDEELASLVRILYAAIDIDLTGQVPGTLVFHRCSFAQRYSPELCAFMSAFDSGFVGGLCGIGGLGFSARITQGAPCCQAQTLSGGCGAGTESGCGMLGYASASK